MAPELSATAERNLARWRSAPHLAEHRAALTSFLAAASTAEVEDAFGADLPFGTAGRRGCEGVGPNRINARTIAESAAGLAVLRPSLAVVGYDGRAHSREYALLSAEVLLAAGARVELFAQACATPQLAHRATTAGAQAAVMITASHNPADHNGFKAFGPHGGQIVPPLDRQVMAAVVGQADLPIGRMPLATALAEGRARWVTRADDEAYLAYVARQAGAGPRDCRLVFSALQGVGGRTVPAVLERAGFTAVALVASQAEPSPLFETLPDGIANPEAPEALAQLIAACAQQDADAGLAADPDADRVGLVARDPDSPHGYRFFRGYELAALIAQHTIVRRARDGRLPAGSVVLRSVVGSRFIDAVAAEYGARVIGDLPIGFKWCGELQADRLDEEHFVAALDESHGFNRGVAVRDKDAASAALALAEIVADCRAEGITVSQRLAGLHTRYGARAEQVFGLRMASAEAMGQFVDRLRSHPPSTLLGRRVSTIVDRLNDPWTSSVSGMAVPENFLMLELAGDDTTGNALVGVRPSGTEPKLKIYALAGGRAEQRAELDNWVQSVPDAMTVL